MMTSLLNNFIVVVVGLLAFSRHGIAEERYVGFNSYYHSTSYYYLNQHIAIIPTSKFFQVVLTGEDFTVKNRTYHEDLTKFLAQKTTEVKCELFISFNENQDVGIHICQEQDNEHFMIPSSKVYQTSPVDYTFSYYYEYSTYYYYYWKVDCKDLPEYIIEGEEVAINCNVIRTSVNINIQPRITIGWIQGRYNIIYDLTTDSNTINLEGFHPGDGLFFYCFSIINYSPTRCYTLILKVYPRLMVDITRFYKTPGVPGEHCFKCKAKCGSGDKTYYWTLNGNPLPENNDHQDEERCVNKLGLPVGNYTMKCLVSTYSQNASDTIIFTSNDDLPTNTATTQTHASCVKDILTTGKMTPQTGTTPQNNVQQRNVNCSEKRSNDKITIIIIITATSTLLLFVVPVFLLTRKYYLQVTMHIQYNRNNLTGTAITGVQQMQIDNDEMYGN